MVEGMRLQISKKHLALKSISVPSCDLRLPSWSYSSGSRWIGYCTTPKSPQHASASGQKTTRFLRVSAHPDTNPRS